MCTGWGVLKFRIHNKMIRCHGRVKDEKHNLTFMTFSLGSISRITKHMVLKVRGRKPGNYNSFYWCNRKSSRLVKIFLVPYHTSLVSTTSLTDQT